MLAMVNTKTWTDTITPLGWNFLSALRSYACPRRSLLLITCLYSGVQCVIQKPAAPCGGLNETSPPSISSISILFGRCRWCSLAEGITSLELDFEIKKPPSLIAQNMSSQNPVPCTMSPCHDGLCPSLGHDMQNKTPFHKLFWLWCFNIATEKQLRHPCRGNHLTPNIS